MRRKIFQITAYSIAVLLCIICLMILYNKTIGIPWKLFRRLPVTVSLNLELSDKHQESKYRDRYFAYLYQYPENCKSLLRNHSIHNSDWNVLPTHKELNNLLMDCFEWPIRNVDFLKEFDLSSGTYTGFWFYNGRMNHLYPHAVFDKDYYFLDSHELIVNIENNNSLIYIWKHE